MSTDQAHSVAPPERKPSRRPSGGTRHEGAVETGTAGRELTFAAIFAVLLRHRALILIVAAVAVGYSVVVALLEPPTYTSFVSFVPQRQTPSFGLASQLGGSGSSDVTQSAPFYAELVTTRTIAGEIVDSTRIRLPSGRQVSLAEALGITAADPIAMRNAAIGTVMNMIRPTVNPRTQVVILAVQAPDPDIAVQVAAAALEAVVRFNHVVHQSAASAERRFIEVRRAELRSELAQAEGRLQEFLRRNRGGLDSPELDFERQRLMTEVNLRRDLYGTLSQGYERARMDEVRDTPVITRIDRPERPLGADPRFVLRVALLALVGGLFAGAVLAFLVESFKVTRAQLRTV